MLTEVVGASNPVVAHYLRLHLIEILSLARERGVSSLESDNILMTSLSRAEASKHCVDLSRGTEAVERMAAETFAAACAADAEGRLDVELAQEYDKACFLLEALAQCREEGVTRDVEQKVHHARQRAALIRRSTQCGMVGAGPCALGLGASHEERPPLEAQTSQPASLLPEPTRTDAVTSDSRELATPHATLNRPPSRVQKAALSKAEQARTALSCNDVAASRRLVAGALEILERGTV